MKYPKPKIMATLLWWYHSKNKARAIYHCRKISQKIDKPKYWRKVLKHLRQIS
jgi:hypothetical protein